MSFAFSEKKRVLMDPTNEPDADIQEIILDNNTNNANVNEVPLVVSDISEETEQENGALSVIAEASIIDLPLVVTQVTDSMGAEEPPIQNGISVSSMDDAASMHPSLNEPNKTETAAASTNKMLDDNAMDDPKDRQITYSSFCQLLQSFINHELFEHLASDIPSALKWLTISYQKYPPDGPYNLYIRVYIFWVLRKLLKGLKDLKIKADNNEEILRLLNACLLLEPLNELVFTMMIEVEAWLSLHDGQMYFDSRESTAALSDMEYFVISWEDVLELPFTTPSQSDSAHFLQNVMSIRSRSDTYSIIIDAVDHLIGRIAWARDQSELNEYKKLTTLQDDPGLIAMKKKMEWLIRFMTSNLKKAPPSSAIMSAAVDVVNRTLSVPDDDPFSGLLDSAYDLKLMLGTLQEQLHSTKGNQPPFVSSQIPTPYIMTLIESKLQEDTTVNVERQVSSVQKSILSSASSDNLSISMAYNQADVLCSIDGIYFQVDPISDKAVAEGDMDQMTQTPFMSVAPGKFVSTHDQILFYGVKVSQHKPGAQYDPLNLSLCIKLKPSSIKRFTSGKLLEGIQVDSNEDQNQEEKRSSDLRRKASVAEQFAQRVKTRRLSAMPTTKKEQENAEYYITLVTLGESFKFFPFLEDEVYKLESIISDMTGLTPFKQSDLLRIMLGNKLSKERQGALNELIQEEDPWIDNSEDLRNLILFLTGDSNLNRLSDTERLYHSCRVEPEVTLETVKLLKDAWDSSTSEASKIKILAVVDRILDKAVMRQGDAAFKLLSKWLKFLEETVSPFKSPKAIKLIENLTRRAKAMQIEPLIPISDEHCKYIFDDWEDFKFWLRFYEIKDLD